MKLADFLSRFLAFLQENELLGAVADKTVWFIACYSTVLGLILALALLCARQGIASFSATHHRKSL